MNQQAPVFKSGAVAIVGRPNVGKSTLLNRILGEKIAIVSEVPQTTRTQIRGIYNDERCQIIFVDTPGMHLGADQLDKMMSQSISGSIDDTDVIIHLVDTQKKIGEEEHNVVERLKGVSKPIILGLNKVDIKNPDIQSYIDLWEKARGCPIQEIKNFHMVALSGEKGLNIDTLIDVICDFLPEGQALYPRDIISDMPQKMVIADIIREKFLHVLRDELPHAVGVFVESVRPTKGHTTSIRAVVMVERPTQKEIVIGKKGEVLKKAGTAARVELEALLEGKVFLDLYVKVQKNWRDNASALQDLGYGQF